MNYLDKAGTLLEGFESSDDWTLAGVGSSKANDTTNYKTGSQGVRVTSVNNTAATITKTISADLSVPDIFTLWVYIDDTSKYATGNATTLFIASTTDFSKTFSATINVGNTMSNGWNKLIFLKSDFTATGGEVWTNTMIRLRMRVVSAADQTVNVTFDDLRYGEYRRPKCIITFDDGIDNVYDEGYSYMRRFGFKGVAYVPGDDRVGADGYMTLAELTEMYNYGWDISNHGLTHTDLTTLENQAAMEADILGGQEYIKSLGFTRNNMYRHLALPASAYDATVLLALVAQNILTSRSGNDRIQPNFTQDNRLLKRVSIANTTTLAAAKAKVDEAITRGGAAIFNFHRLVASPGISTEWAIADFQDLMEYLYQKSASIDVVTITEWYRGLTEPRRLV